MPTALMRKYSRESGKSLEQVEKCWDKAKVIAKTKFKKQDEHFWAYVNASTRKCLGLKDHTTSKGNNKNHGIKITGQKSK